MIHLLKDPLGRFEAFVDANTPGLRICCGGNFPDERSALLAGAECIIRNALYEFNCNTFEEWTQLAAIIGPEKTDVLFSIIPHKIIYK